MATDVPAVTPAPNVPHRDVAERVARGRSARAAVPRSAHTGFAPSPAREDPVELLRSQDATRVPELVPIRYGRMLVSPFAFFRGAALVMANDLAPCPVSGIKVQLCGDAHLSNFGAFASPERRLVFDINDFDETLSGPWEWDVKRLAASIEIAGRDNGFRQEDRAAAVAAAVGSYRSAMTDFAAWTNLDVFYASMDVERLLQDRGATLGRKTRERTEASIAKARTRDNMQALGKLTRRIDGELRIASDPPLVVPVAELAGPDLSPESVTEAIRGLLREYRRSLPIDRRRLLEGYRLVDVARKVVGVGSVGTRAWIALVLGRDELDPLFLQVKEAGASVLERYLGRSGYRNSGHRVVAGQRLMQAAGDIFLGHIRGAAGIDGVPRDFYVRQLRDWKTSAPIDELNAKSMLVYAQLCGWTLARAHARSGDRIAIAAYLGKGDAFDRALVRFAAAYADQNERDYEALVAAAADGRVEAQTGV